MLNNPGARLVCVQVSTEMRFKPLTRFANNAADPGAEVIHLFDTSFKLAAVMSPINLPVAARTAPKRPPVGIAHKDVLAVEELEARTIGVAVRTRLVPLARFEVCLGTSAAPFPFLGRFPQLDGLLPKRSYARVVLYYDKDAKVRHEHQQKKKKIENQKDRRSAGLMSSVEEEVDWRNH